MKTDNFAVIITFGILLVHVTIYLFILSTISDLRKNIDENDKEILNVIVREISPPPAPYVENIEIVNDPTLGADDSVITIIEFGDYECPFCAASLGYIETLLEEYEGQIQYVFKDFPIQHIHPNAFMAAEAAHCADDQNHFWEMHKAIFQSEALNQDTFLTLAAGLPLDIEIFEDCLNNHIHRDEIEKDIALANQYDVRSTPTFFINGHRVIGLNADIIEQIIKNEILNNSKIKIFG